MYLTFLGDTFTLSIETLPGECAIGCDTVHVRSAVDSEAMVAKDLGPTCDLLRWSGCRLACDVILAR